jgi:hypothetical protein
MEAEKHSRISKIGEGVLTDRIAAGNPGRTLRLGAFYLGNWITDVSQIVDPVAYRRVAAKVKVPDLNALFTKFIHDAPSWIKGPIEASDTLNKLRDKLALAEKELETYIKETLNAGTSGDLAKAFKEGFKYLGYFKFVAPTTMVGTDRMHADSYLDSFDRLFHQYYPLEHLDRPEASRDHYATKVSPGPRNKHTVPPPSSHGDLYDYLRDDLEIAAARFAYLDAGVPDVADRASWAVGTFTPGRDDFTDEIGRTQSVSDTNLEWNYHLALLGHSLHAIEDFYAHSTFVENANIALPASYKRLQKAEQKEILLRRLKQWSYGYDEDKWDSLPREANIVTGYFDFIDTLVSISHLVEDLFDWNRDGPGKAGDAVLEYDYKKLLTDTLDFVSDPKGVLTRNNPKAPGYDEDKANTAAKFLWDKYNKEIGDNIDKLKEGDDKTFQYVNFLLESPLLAGAPQPIKDSFLKAAKLFGQFKGARNLYKTLKKVHKFIKKPWDFIRDILKDSIVKALVEPVEGYVISLVEGLVGARRIGCHSLIAKDAGHELFYDAGMACAETVHWYVVNTLGRYSRPYGIAACRTSAPLNHVNGIFCQWIDWQELVEFFLAHPLAEMQVIEDDAKIETTIYYKTKGGDGSKMSRDTLENLGTFFAATAVVYNPTTGLVEDMPDFSWETIADANFPTKGMKTPERQRQINKILAHQPDKAMIVSDHINYAFRPGYVLQIPHQLDRMPGTTSPLGPRRWWYPVILQTASEAMTEELKASTAVIANWYASDGSLSASAPADAHRPIPVSHAEVLQLIKDADTLRKSLEKAYNGSA